MVAGDSGIWSYQIHYLETKSDVHSLSSSSFELCSEVQFMDWAVFLLQQPNQDIPAKHAQKLAS